MLNFFFVEGCAELLLTSLWMGVHRKRDSVLAICHIEVWVLEASLIYQIKFKLFVFYFGR